MDRKIILELIRKDIDELQLLVSALAVNSDPDNILLEITTSRIQTVLHQLSLLKSNETIKIEKTETLTSVKTIELKFESQNSQIDNEHEIEAKTDVQHNFEEDITSSKASVASAEKQPEVTSGKADDKVEEIISDEVLVEELEDELVEEPQPQSEPQSEPENEEKNRRVFGEQFTKEPSLNERFSDLKQNRATVISQPVISIRKAIGLNDRFMYIRELFDNDTVVFEKTIDAIDNAKNIVEALEYLEQHFKWKRDEISLKFMELVKRRHDV